MVHRSAKVNKRRLPLGLFLGTYFGNTTLQVANVSGKLDFCSIFCYLFSLHTHTHKKKPSEINRVKRHVSGSAVGCESLLSHDWLDIVL